MTLRDISEKTEQYAVEIINGRQRTWYDTLFRIFLFMLSRGYQGIVQLRLNLYGNRILRQHEMGCFVVSVGNLTTGGTGKTPVVELLARTLADRGRRVAVLSRGYRSKARPWREKLLSFIKKGKDAVLPRVVSDGKRVLLDSSQSGDEPYMLARNLVNPNGNGVAVVVDKDRVKGGKYAIRHFQADTLILDDGFQHLQLRPWLNILLVDTTNPFHNHEPLPVGLLREPICNMERADFIFLTKSNGGKHLRHLRGFLHRHNPKARIIECNHVPCYLQRVDGDERLPLEALAGKPLAALSAIAVPTSFENFLSGLGGNIVFRKRYVDHHRYHAKELREFCREAEAAGAELLVTTEKDAVRLPELPAKRLPFYFLRVEIKILRGEENFNHCINEICLK